MLEGTDERVKLQRNALKVLETPAGADLVRVVQSRLHTNTLSGHSQCLTVVKVIAGS